MAVVDSRIEYICTQLDGPCKGVTVERVAGGARLTKVGAETDRGEPEALRLTKVSWQAIAKAAAKARCALRCGVALNEGRFHGHLRLVAAGHLALAAFLARPHQKNRNL